MNGIVHLMEEEKPEYGRPVVIIYKKNGNIWNNQHYDCGCLYQDYYSGNAFDLDGEYSVHIREVHGWIYQEDLDNLLGITMKAR